MTWTLEILILAVPLAAYELMCLPLTGVAVAMGKAAEDVPAAVANTMGAKAAPGVPPARHDSAPAGTENGLSVATEGFTAGSGLRNVPPGVATRRASKGRPP